MTLTYPDTATLEEALGYTFEDRALLMQALTHSTYANEHPSEGRPNERLEFLGDAVINLLAGRLLFERLPDESEGELTRRRAQVVRREALADMSRQLGTPAHLRLGHGQKATGGVTPRVLADVFEALAAAVFLDGGFEAADRSFSRLLAQAIDQSGGPVDFKTKLQEHCHRAGTAAPAYEIVSVSGPDHARAYTCRVVIDGTPFGQGTASSKKVAEQSCAEQAIAALSGESA